MAVIDRPVRLLDPSSALVGTELFYADNGTLDVKVTANQLRSFVAAGGGSSSGRALLLADTTFYVSTTGSDVSGTGTVSNPWRTPQHAYNTLAESYDFGGFDVIVQFADGDYRNTTPGDFPNANGLSIRAPWTGGGFLTFQGNLSNRTAVKFGSTQANACALELDQVNIPSQLTFRNIQLILPEVTAFAVFSGNYVGQCILSGCDFGGAASGGGAKVDISNFVAGMTLKIGGPMTFLSNGGFSNIAGYGAQLVLFAFPGGDIELGIGGVGVTSTDGPWMEMQAGGQVLLLGNSFIGQITGVGYNVHEGAMFQAPLGGPPPSTLPGTISSGGQVDFSNFATNDWTTALGCVLDGKINYQVPVNGFSITLNDRDWHVLLIPAGTLTSGTITFPNNPFDGQIINVASTQYVRGLTLIPGSGDSFVGAPTLINPGGSFDAIFRQSNSTWYFRSSPAPGREGADLQFQFNKSGSLAGCEAFTFVTGGEIQLGDASNQGFFDLWSGVGSNLTSLASLATSIWTFWFPTGAGSAGQQLLNTGAGVMSWVNGYNGTPVAVASLPAAGVKGRRAFVNNANAATFNTIVASGGANNVPVFDDGTNWRIG